MSAERQRYLLFGLAAVLAVVVVRQYRAASTATTAAVVAARRAASAAVPPPPADVGLAALEEARPGPDDGGRNPFVFGARQATVPEGGPRRARQPAEAGLPPPVLPPGPPPLPPIPFKFIGLVEGTTSARKIAVLSDSKGLVVHGTEGTIIDGRYRILAIGAESIDIAYADGRGRQTLRLSGQ
ncbi:MAG: hypothetical protein AB7O28_21455 [Vicinamibacterales bacterium]